MPSTKTQEYKPSRKLRLVRHFCWTFQLQRHKNTSQVGSYVVLDIPPEQCQLQRRKNSSQVGSYVVLDIPPEQYQLQRRKNTSQVGSYVVLDK